MVRRRVGRNDWLGWVTFLHIHWGIFFIWGGGQNVGKCRRLKRWSVCVVLNKKKEKEEEKQWLEERKWKKKKVEIWNREREEMKRGGDMGGVQRKVIYVPRIRGLCKNQYTHTNMWMIWASVFSLNGLFFNGGRSDESISNEAMFGGASDALIEAPWSFPASQSLWISFTSFRFTVALMAQKHTQADSPWKCIKDRAS